MTESVSNPDRQDDGLPALPIQVAHVSWFGRLSPPGTATMAEIAAALSGEPFEDFKEST